VLVIGVAAPLGYIGLTAIKGLWEANRRQVDESVQKQAQLTAVAFEQWVEAQREPLTTLASRIDDPDTDRETIREMIASAVSARPHWAGLRVVGADGRTVASNSEDAPEIPAEIVARLLSQTRDAVWAVKSDWTRGPSDSALVIAVPLEDGGALFSQVHLPTWSQSFMKQVELPDETIMAVLGPQWHVLFYRGAGAGGYLGMDLSESAFIDALAGRKRAVVELESPLDGKRRVYGLASAGGSGAVVLVGVPSEALYRPVRHEIVRYSFLSALALLLVLAVTLVLSRSIARPMRRLAEAARAFGEGDLESRAPAGSGGEIEALGRAFNAMADRIQKREHKLAELNQLKSDFVSGVSHELRTPLTTIKTLTRVLLRTKVDERERREYLETVASECDREINLVLNLLDLSRIEAGTFDVPIRPVNVLEVIRGCFEIERYGAEARGHRFQIDVEGDLPRALADRTALRRVLCSLVENAVKYTPDGGEITLAAASQGADVRISVIDNGIGIAEEDLPRIFGKFYRGRRTASNSDAPEAAETAVTPGVGLGLYLARTIVEGVGGRITAENRPGGGSRFDIVLPAELADDAVETPHDYVKAITHR
jgi:signal transduction histidine kinase